MKIREINHEARRLPTSWTGRQLSFTYKLYCSDSIHMGGRADIVNQEKYLSNANKAYWVFTSQKKKEKRKLGQSLCLGEELNSSC